jgi:hypothetical protein
MRFVNWHKSIKSLDRVWLPTDTSYGLGDDRPSQFGSSRLQEVWLFDVKPCLLTMTHNYPDHYATRELILDECFHYIRKSEPVFKEFQSDLFVAFRIARNICTNKRSPLLLTLIDETIPQKTGSDG